MTVSRSYKNVKCQASVSQKEEKNLDKKQNGWNFWNWPYWCYLLWWYSLEFPQERSSAACCEGFVNPGNEIHNSNYIFFNSTSNFYMVYVIFTRFQGKGIP